MTPEHVTDLLTYIRAMDGRSVGKVDIAMWVNILPKHFELQAAMEAVDLHRQESAEWLMPAHVIQNYRRVMDGRRREQARQTALAQKRPEPVVVPWWFKPLRDAEAENYARARETDPMYGRRVMNLPPGGGDPVVPQYEGDELTLAQKLKKYNITRKPGDAEASVKLAQTEVPHLGKFLRDPEPDDGDFG